MKRILGYLAALFVFVWTAAAATPAITAGGIVPVYSKTSTIQPGEWVSIYGTNLAGSTASWNGDGKAAYLWYVSATQINLQAPDDTATGSVPVVVKTAGGNATARCGFDRRAASAAATFERESVVLDYSQWRVGNGDSDAYRRGAFRWNDGVVIVGFRVGIVARLGHGRGRDYVGYVRGFGVGGQLFADHYDNGFV